MSVFAFGVILLAVSSVSLTVYFITLHQLVRHPHSPGLVRTAACRVVAAFLYLVIGMSTIAGHKTSILVTLGVFIIIQLIWQANSIADMVLTRRRNTRQGRSDGHTNRTTSNAKHRVPD